MEVGGQVIKSEEHALNLSSDQILAFEDVERIPEIVASNGFPSGKSEPQRLEASSCGGCY